MVKSTRPGTAFATPAIHRRAFLQRSAAASGIFLLPAGFGSGAFAQDMTKMVHQLGWVKSIQFGGHFAAIEQGYFAEEGIEAEFLAGGPGGIGTDVSVASDRR